MTMPVSGVPEALLALAGFAVAGTGVSVGASVGFTVAEGEGAGVKDGGAVAVWVTSGGVVAMGDGGADGDGDADG